MTRIETRAIIVKLFIVGLIIVALIGAYSYIEEATINTPAPDTASAPKSDLAAQPKDTSAALPTENGNTSSTETSIGTSAVTTAAATTPTETPKTRPADKSVLASLDQATGLARNGQLDASLKELAQLHDRYPGTVEVTRDYIAVLSWAGHDEEAVHLYETIAPEQPDYVLAAVGHSYRVLHQPEKALHAYELGSLRYPDNVTFVEGELRSLTDTKNFDEAAKRAEADLNKHGSRPEIIAAKADIVQMQIRDAQDKAVQLGRNKEYDAALALFHGSLLDADHTYDAAIRRDYLAVLSWTGKNDDKVIEIFSQLKEEDQNVDYVLDAAAKSYRNKRNPEKALQLYRHGAKLYPENLSFEQGVIFCLLDQQKFDEASRAITAYETAHGKSDQMETARRSIAQIKFNAVRSKAAILARKGQFNEAFAILQKLGGEHTKNVGILQDKLVITGWMGGHDQEVIDQYNALKNPDQPAYVLEAVGKAYRNLGQSDKAAEIYQRGLKKHPADEELAVGVIRTLTEAGYVEKALEYANDNLKRYGKRLGILLAAADAANQYDHTDAMRYYQMAASIAPKDPDVLRGFVRTADRQGAPQVALEIIAKNPGLVSDAERRMIEGDEIASSVRLGMLQQQKNPRNFNGTDHAIKEANNRIEHWSKEGPAAKVNIQRARFDRMIALHNRLRMKDVTNEYEILASENAEFPSFTLGAVGDAYLDQHEPEKARDIYLRQLQIEPNNNLAKRQLFYAYVDTGDYKNAYRTADEMVKEGKVWNRHSNTMVPKTDAEHRDAELTAGAARLYFGEVTEADERLLPVIANNLNSPEAHEALGNLDSAHGLPHAALNAYQSGVQLAGGQDMSNEIGVANTQLALHNYPEAEAQINSLVARYPENLSVKRVKRDFDVYNMNELNIRAGYEFEPDTIHNVSGGQAYGVEAKIYSKPFWYNWRLFAGEFYTHQKEPNDEGLIDFSRSTLGIEYRKGPVTANFAPTYNSYRNGDRIGVAGDASYDIDDHWTVAGSGEIFSRQTPLRALNQGVTTNYVGGHAVWQEDESQSVRFGGSIMPFSDDNLRTAEDISYTRRMVTKPFWRLDGIASLGLDQNSEDSNRSYYNPSSAALGLVGAKFVQTLYQRYATIWQHTIEVAPGVYWQSHYGSDAALRMRYEHRVFLSESFEAGLGLNYRRQSYDGDAENDFSVTFDLVDHF